MWGWGASLRVHRTLVLGSGLFRVSRLREEAGLLGGLRLGRDQRPTVAGPKDMQMALRAKHKAG